MSHAFVTATLATEANMMGVVHYTPIMRGFSVQREAHCCFTQPEYELLLHDYKIMTYFFIFFFWHIAFRNPIKGQKQHHFVIIIPVLWVNRATLFSASLPVIFPTVTILTLYFTSMIWSAKSHLFRLFGMSFKWTVDFCSSTTEPYYSYTASFVAYKCN